MVSIIRKYLLFICAVMALMGSLVATFATYSLRDYMLRGYVDATKTQDLPYKIPLLGINAELLQYTQDELHYHLRLMQNANIHWVRQFVYWDNIEPIQGVYDWSQWDMLISILETYPSLELVAVFVDAPEWAQTTPSDPTSQRTAPPSNPQDFATFIGEFVQRYGHIITYYQIWDEPNIQLGWGNTSPNVAHYVAMLQSAYSAIHANDPSAQVIGAGLAPTTETNRHNMNEFDFMRDMYAHGAKDFTDAWAGMPFGFDTSPNDRVVDVNHLNFSRFVMLREIMVQHDDGKKPLWAGAWGWNTLPENWDGAPSLWRNVSLNQQVDYTLQALQRAEREWAWVGGMILYHWQPDALPHDPRWGFALISADNTPTPLYETLKNRAINDFATNGLYRAQNPYTRYSGAWSFSEAGADIGWVQDSALEFNFYGRDVALHIRQDNVIAHFYITIDDMPANNLPKDMAGNSYLTLRSATLRPSIELKTVATHLSNEKHTLRLLADELVPDELTQRYPLIGFAVSSGDLYAPYNRQIAIGWFSTAISLIALVITVRAVNLMWLLNSWQMAWQRLSDTTQLIIGAFASVALLLAMFLAWHQGVPTFFKRDSVQLGVALLTAGMIYLNIHLIITAIAILLLFIIVYHRLEIGILLVVFWSPFFLFPVELYRFAFPLAEVILLITTFAGLLRGLAWIGQDNQLLPKAMRRWNWARHLNPLDILMALWLILGLFGILQATYRSPAITEFRTLFIEPVLLYMLIRTCNYDKNRLMRLLEVLLLSGMAVSLIGMAMWLRGEAIITAEDGVRRLASVYGSPNNVGLLLGRCIPIALALSLIGENQMRRLFGVIALVIMGIALILTQSAGALFIGVPVASVMVIVLALRKKALLPLIGLFLLVIIGAVVASQSPRFDRLMDMTSGTNFYRLRAWQSAVNMLENYPITGIGLDQYLYYFRDGYMLPDAWQEPDLSHPHNIVLDIWLRLGVFGVIWLIAFLWIWSKEAWRLYRQYHAIQNRAMLIFVIGVIGSMTNLVAHGLVDNSIFVADLAIIFSLLAGVLSTLWHRDISSLPS